MKKLGLIGGMGPESTIPYYHDIVYGVQRRVGADFFPSLTIESVNVYEVLRLCGAQQYDELTDYLMAAVRHLTLCGVDFIALTANTPHIVFDRLQAQSPVPLVSIIDATRDEALRLHLRRLGLLGTVFTMTGDFFRQPFLRSGIDIITPTPAEMAWVNEKISAELEHGITTPETLAGFQQIIARMKHDSGIEALILGCTELPLLLNDAAASLSCLDTMQIHVQRLIDIIVA